MNGNSPNENNNPLAVKRIAMRRSHTPDIEKYPAKRSRVDVKEDFEEIEDSLDEGSDDFNVAGRVVMVSLENFMCHRNLQIVFNTDKNNCFYIGGPNGSGKSALFAAINLGLGGRGNDNDRGNSIKSYVKDGTTSAKIRIVLTNIGENAHPQFGKYIVVERSITQSSSTYQLKTMKDFDFIREKTVEESLVSKKKADVDRIIERFNIQLHNPAFWMSQDRCRSFLANLKPGSVYKLYLEATNLDELMMSYERLAETLSELKSIVDVRKLECSKKAKELRRMQEIRAATYRLEDDKKELLRLQYMFIYCPVRDADEDLLVHKEKVRQTRIEIDSIRQKSLRNRTKRQAMLEEVDEVKEAADEYQEKISECRSHFNETKSLVAKEQTAIHRLDEEIRDRKSEKKNYENKIRTAEHRVSEIMKAKGRNEVQKQLEEAEHAVNKLERQIRQHEESDDSARLQHDLQESESARDELEQKRLEAQDCENTLRRKLDTAKQQLDTYRASKVDSINRFGPFMRKVLQIIGKNKEKFSKVPKGPLGNHITINDPRWEFAIEECIGRHAYSFLCNSTQDAALLRRIFNDANVPPRNRPGILVSRFHGRPFQNLEEPPSKWNTVYRMLNISDPDVHNAIIDYGHVESILLLDRDDEAMRLMDGNSPPFATRAYTASGATAISSTTGQYRFYACHKNDRSPQGLFDGSVNTGHQMDEKSAEENIREMEAQYDKLVKIELNEIKSQFQKACRSHDDAKRAQSAFEKKCNDLQTSLRRAKKEYEDIHKKISEDDGAEEIDSLNSAISDFKSRIEGLDGTVHEIEKKRGEHNQAVKNLEGRDDDVKKEEDAFLKKLKEERIKLDKCRESVNSLDAVGERYEQKLKQMESNSRLHLDEDVELHKKRDAALAMFEEGKAKFPSIPEGATDPPDLSNFPATSDAARKIEEKKRKIDRASEAIDHTVTTESLREFKTKIIAEKTCTIALFNVHEKMNKILTDRVNNFPKLRFTTENKVRSVYQEMLDYRDFKGDLVFDNESRTLNVTVTKRGKNKGDGDDEDSEEDVRESQQPIYVRNTAAPTPKKKKGNSDKNKQVRDLKGLSGGERSFVTACLIMALWKVMDQPFRMLDEFDVFMDSMNRKVVMEILVRLATEKYPHRQFIFFTPQGIKELKPNERLQIFEMPKVRP